MKDLDSKDQKNAIAREAGTFLKQEFGIPSDSIGVLMENAMILMKGN